MFKVFKDFRGLVLWTMLCLAGFMGLVSWSGRTTTYDQEEFLIAVDGRRQLEVTGTVFIEGGSDTDFDFKRMGAASLDAKEAEKPLGWSSEKYYFLEKSEMTGGIWKVHTTSDVWVQVYNPENETLVVRMTTGAWISFGVALFLSFLIIWAMGSALYMIINHPFLTPDRIRELF